MPTCNVKVCCRFRPLNVKETVSGKGLWCVCARLPSRVCWCPNHAHVCVCPHPHPRVVQCKRR
jgi:hypothetical protein